jgi:hypothetical protein
MRRMEMIEQLPTGSPKVLAFRLSGKLQDHDYETFVPIVDAAIRAEGRVRLVAQFEAFEGWDLHAAWDDMKFGVRHYADFERIAMIGDRKWEQWMAKLCRPFTRASVRYFDAAQAEAAWAWAKEGA